MMGGAPAVAARAQERIERFDRLDDSLGVVLIVGLPSGLSRSRRISGFFATAVSAAAAATAGSSSPNFFFISSKAFSVAGAFSSA